MLDFLMLAAQCAPAVHPDTMRRVVDVESGFNPFAIGVVGGRLERQPASLQEAVLTAANLRRQGLNFSVGLAQVNQANFNRYGLSLRSAFDPCENLRAGAQILAGCFDRARASRVEQIALRAAMSCYYSGNFVTGYSHGYVDRIVHADGVERPFRVPAIDPSASDRLQRAIPVRASARGALTTQIGAHGSEPKPSYREQHTASDPRSALLF